MPSLLGNYGIENNESFFLVSRLQSEDGGSSASWSSKQRSFKDDMKNKHPETMHLKTRGLS